MARNSRTMPPDLMPMEPMKADCVPCLEDVGLWYFAQKVRMGENVYEYDVEEALEPSHYGPQNNQTVLPPIRNAAGTNSVAAMISEGCPPNTGRHYEKV